MKALIFYDIMGSFIVCKTVKGVSNMQSIDMEFAKNLLASFQELQRSHAALQKRMAEFESMAAAKFEAYEAELAKKDAVIASLRTTIARQEAELERYRDKDKTNSNNSHMSPSKDKTKAAHKEKRSKDKSAKKQGAQPGHKGSGLSLPSHYDREEISFLTPKPCRAALQGSFIPVFHVLVCERPDTRSMSRFR